MTNGEVPPLTELFNIAMHTRAACDHILGESVESAHRLLTAAAFHLQAAHVGARMAEMSNDGQYTDSLRAVATDYGGVESASLNLSVRCSVTTVDLCGAALGRLTRLNAGKREWDAKNTFGRLTARPVNGELSQLAAAYLIRLQSSDWTQTETIRHQLTHRTYPPLGKYLTTQKAPQPPPLAWPQQDDVEWGNGGMMPLDELSRKVVDFADATFREFCTSLAALA